MQNRATINSFRWMPLKGGVNLRKPEVEYIIFEDCECTPYLLPEGSVRQEGTRADWFGR